MDSDEVEESALLHIWEQPASDREKRAAVQSLERVGGRTTLDRIERPADVHLLPAASKLKANIARKTDAGALDLDAQLDNARGVRLTVSCRSGLEAFVREEIAQDSSLREIVTECSSGEGSKRLSNRIELSAQTTFSLKTLLQSRCWSELSFPLGKLPPLPHRGAPPPISDIARIASSPLAWTVMRSFTRGVIRYRWEFPARRLQGEEARHLAERVEINQPELINDPRQALWEIRVEENPREICVSLVPKFRPDPRFAYRCGDVPAASHPPLAAAIARLSGAGNAPFAGRERIWDPFCGSGLELAECARLSPPAHIYGTDTDPDACRIAPANIRAALAQSGFDAGPMNFVQNDFRNARQQGIPSRDLTLIVTNPPLGKRVPQRDLIELMSALFRLAEESLAPGGRLVLVNPCRAPGIQTSLHRSSSRRVDLGFSHFQLEKYIKVQTVRHTASTRTASMIAQKKSRFGKGRS